METRHHWAAMCRRAVALTAAAALTAACGSAVQPPRLPPTTAAARPSLPVTTAVPGCDLTARFPVAPHPAQESDPQGSVSVLLASGPDGSGSPAEYGVGCVATSATSSGAIDSLTAFADSFAGGAGGQLGPISATTAQTHTAIVTSVTLPNSRMLHVEVIAAPPGIVVAFVGPGSQTGDFSAFIAGLRFGASS